jgi:ParB family chromosome partitioning protein
MSSTTRTIDQLCLSHLNVRTHADAVNDEAIAIMERLLMGQGQLEPILVHPMRGSKNLWGAHAGGRRYRAFKNLTGRGDLPADHPIKVEIREGLSDAELVEESLGENIGRRDLEPYETFAGVRRAHKLGHSVDQIADALGQKRSAIERMLRLGSLAKPIFDALAQGRISVDQARAFGATQDSAAQLAAWEKLSAGTVMFTSTTDRIRAALGIGNHELDRLLTFVTEDAYVAAGGRLEPDLFGAGLTRIVDVDKLRDLADRALDVLRADVRRRTGRPDLRFVPQAPQDSLGTTDHQLRVPVADKAAASIKLPDGDIVAQVYVDHAGKAGVDYWWSSRTAKYANQKGSADAAAASPRAVDAAIAAEALKPGSAIGQQYDGSRQVANAALREEEGLSAESVSIFCSVRRAILRGFLVDDAEAGLSGATDWLVWSQLRLAMDMDAQPKLLGVAKGIGAGPDPEIAREHVQAMPAHARWREVMDELRQQSFVTSKDLCAAFADYCVSPARLKRLAAAAVAGWSLEPSLAAPGYVVPVHHELARQLGVMRYNHDDTVRARWTPTEQLLGRIPTRQLLAIAEPLVDAAAFTSWTKAKAAEVVRRLTQIVTGEHVRGVRADRADAAARWVHPLLRFCPAEDERDPDDPGPVNDVALELAEAAE